MDNNTTSTASETEIFAHDVLIGLTAPQKHLNSKYIYDDEGSKWFEEIMKLDEYYLTRCEYEILEQQKELIASRFEGGEYNLVELGAGNGAKTSILLEHLLSRNNKFTYYPVDISEHALKQAEQSHRQKLPSLSFHGIQMEYFNGLRWIKEHSRQKTIVLFMGANIGNLTPDKMQEFLLSLWDSLNPGDLLMIGFDLVKNFRVINKAYNDNKGVTRRFQLNLLNRMNKELGANFNPDQFDYYSSFNPFTSAIESFVVSLVQQDVYVEALKKSFSFEPFEAIHTEYSFKFTLNSIENWAEGAGFSIVENFFDSRKYFVDSLWKVNEGR